MENKYSWLNNKNNNNHKIILNKRDHTFHIAYCTTQFANPCYTKVDKPFTAYIILNRLNGTEGSINFLHLNS